MIFLAWDSSCEPLEVVHCYFPHDHCSTVYICTSMSYACTVELHSSAHQNYGHFDLPGSYCIMRNNAQFIAHAACALAIELALSGHKQSVVTLEKKLKGIAMAKDGMSRVCFFQIPKSTVADIHVLWKQSNPALLDKRSSIVSVKFSLGVVVSGGI